MSHDTAESPSKKRGRDKSNLKLQYAFIFKTISELTAQWKVLDSSVPLADRALVLAPKIRLLYDLDVQFPTFLNFIADAEGMEELNTERENVKTWCSICALEIADMFERYGEKTLLEKISAHPDLLSWMTPSLKRHRAKQENRALVIASVKRQYQDKVVSKLKKIQENMVGYSLNSERFFQQWNSAKLSSVEKIIAFSDYCFVLRDTQYAIQDLRRCHETTLECIQAIGNLNLTQKMSSTADAIDAIIRQLSEEINSTLKEVGELHKHYYLESENLDEELQAFMKPWLNKAISNPIQDSTLAMESHQAQQEVNHGVNYLRANHVLVQTQTRSRSSV